MIRTEFQAKAHTLHEKSPAAEFDKLKHLISSLTDNKKLKLNAETELVTKHRKPFKAEIGSSIKSQMAINDAVFQLLQFSRKDLPADELLLIADHLKKNEWGAEALKHDPAKKNFTLLENFLKARISMDELSGEYNKNDKECYSLASSASSADFDKLDELEANLKSKKVVYDNLKTIIDNLLKSQTISNSSGNSLRGGKG